MILLQLMWVKIMNIEDKKLLFSIINAGLKNERVDLSSLNEDSSLMKIIKEQTFQPFLYYVSSDSRFKKYYLASYLLIEKFEKLKDLIKKLFDENNIDHIFLKGTELRYLFPDKNLRLSGDIDVLVRKKDYKKAKEILKNNAFIFDDECEHHAGFKINGVEIELHRLLLPHTDEFAPYFVDAFNHAHIKDKHTYEFENEYNFCYILAHYIKHLYKGAGLRELCDVYVMLDKLDIDMNKVKPFLKEYDLEKFFNTLLNQLNILFDYNAIPFEENPSAYKLIDFSLDSGIHGNGEKGDQLINLQRNISKNSKFKFLLSKLFIPIRSLFVLYPWTKSIILIPFGYFARLLHLLFNRRRQLKHIINSDKFESDNLFEEVGL